LNTLRRIAHTRRPARFAGWGGELLTAAVMLGAGAAHLAGAA
jgi:hypothetical protein